VTLLRVQGVTHHYGGNPALRDIDLVINAGERVALIGPSGSGKSTLLRLLNGSLTPTTGEIFIAGQALSPLRGPARRALQQQVGTIYQQLHLVENLRVIHNVNAGQLGRWPWPKALFSLVWPQEVETARKALAQVGIAEQLYRRTDQLSGGEQQRVALARVLVQAPQILLADEPIASLDPERSREVLELLTAQAPTTLVMSLHTPALAQQFCNRLIGLREGRVLFDAPTCSAAQLAQLYQL
jgi:phosphonate transport system ATP-binding protein